MRKTVIFLLSLSFSLVRVPPVRAQTVETKPAHELFESLDYPELQVVPLASQRLEMEARDEKVNWWYVHWSLQASALATFTLSLMAGSYERDDLSENDRDDFSTAKTGGMLLGLGWLTATVLVGVKKPYGAAYAELRKTESKTKRGQLLRERLAEETFERQAELMRKLRIASVVSNVLMSAYLGSFVEGDGSILTAASVLLGFLPLWVKDRHIYTYEKHIEYKRNIYAPVASLRFRPQVHEGEMKVYPSLNFAWEL